MLAANTANSHLTQSMSRKGECLDRADGELLCFSEKELHRQRFKTRAQAKVASLNTSFLQPAA